VYHKWLRISCRPTGDAHGRAITMPQYFVSEWDTVATAGVRHGVVSQPRQNGFGLTTKASAGLWRRDQNYKLLPFLLRYEKSQMLLKMEIRQSDLRGLPIMWKADLHAKISPVTKRGVRLSLKDLYESQYTLCVFIIT
jgi:hypothetical protein